MEPIGSSVAIAPDRNMEIELQDFLSWLREKHPRHSDIADIHEKAYALEEIMTEMLTGKKRRASYEEIQQLVPPSKWETLQDLWDDFLREYPTSTT